MSERMDINVRNIIFCELLYNLTRPAHFIYLGGALHGDMLQYERDKVLREYKNNEFPILVATDVAGRLSKLIMNEDTMISFVKTVLLFIVTKSERA